MGPNGSFHTLVEFFHVQGRAGTNPYPLLDQLASLLFDVLVNC